MQIEKKKWCAIILAGGSGRRMGAAENKVLMPYFAGKSALEKSVCAFLNFVGTIVVVMRHEDKEKISSMHFPEQLIFAEGGTTRQDSCWNGLCCVPDSAEYVMIHDSARCLIDSETILRVIESTQEYGSGVAAVPLTDTVKQTDKSGFVTSTPDRDTLRMIQTPQGFSKNTIRAAHIKAMADSFVGTDDASLVEHMGECVRLVEGSRRNMKLTNPEDVGIMQMLDGECENRNTSFRIGSGYDVHRLGENRRLILCGVDIPYEKGLIGHSDADVAVHALMDAMLGAAASGDIGKLFPDTSDEYLGISSMLLLKKVNELLKSNQWKVINADVTIVAQKPKLAPYTYEMRKNIADALEIGIDCVSVKATTTEQLGFEGRQEGISANAVALLSKA